MPDPKAANEVPKQSAPTDYIRTKPVTPPPFSGYQKFVIALLALLQFTIVLDFMIISPLGDILMKSLYLSPSQFGSVVSAYAISAGISGIMTAGFADKFDRKRLLLFFYAGFIAGTIVCGMVNTYETLLMARIITGVFGGVVGSISMAIVTDLFAINQRGRVMSFVQMSFAGSQILGVPIGILLANQWGWNSAFFMVATVAGCVGIALLLRLQPIIEHLKYQRDKNALQHVWHTLQKRDYRVSFLATTMLSMGGFMLMPFTSPFLVNNVLIAQEDLPIIFFFTGISTIIIMPLIGKLSDRVDRYKIFVVGSLIACVMIVIYTNLTPVPIWIVIGINMILFMGIMGRVVPAVALNSAVPDIHDRGAFMSVNASLQQMAGGFAAMFAGIVVVQETKTNPLEHFNWLGYIMVALILWCLYLVYRVKRIVDRKTVRP